MGLSERYIHKNLLIPVNLFRISSTPVYRFGFLVLILCFLMLIASYSYVQYDSSMHEAKKTMIPQELWNVKVVQSVPLEIMETNGGQRNLSSQADEYVEEKYNDNTGNLRKLLSFPSIVNFIFIFGRQKLFCGQKILLQINQN